MRRIRNECREMHLATYPSEEIAFGGDERERYKARGQGVYASGTSSPIRPCHLVKRFVHPPPGTRSRRFDHHDYRGGAYFVTTNTKKRVPLFGRVEDGRMYLNVFGRIVTEEWNRTEELRDEVSLDTFIVMPDHVHGILWICHPDEESLQEKISEEGASRGKDSGMEGREMHLATSSDLPPGLEKRRSGTLSTIMATFKAAVIRRINEERGTPGDTVWQSSFHDRIIRNRTELRHIR